MVHVIRVPVIVGNIELAIDDRPGSWILFVREDVMSEDAAKLLERIFRIGIMYWMRAPGTVRLQAV